VTGAGTRLGKAIAVALGSAGMQVAVHYHTHRQGAQDTARQIEASGGRAHLCPADLSRRQDARALVDSAISALGGLDLLVSSAGNFEGVPLGEISDDDWDRSLGLDLASPFAMAQRAISALRESHGSMVFITCSSVVCPFPGYLPYVVAKAGLFQLMRALALQLAPEVRVNAVAPGLVLPPDEMDPRRVETLVGRLPLQRAGSPADVVRAVIYLASSPFVTGEQLLVDGGRSLARSGR
jgi:pteridine reductase